MRQQDAHVLDRRDQVILELLSPESPPTCAFKVMVVGGIGKTGFHQMLASFAITARGRSCEPERALHLVPLGFHAFAPCAHGATGCIEGAWHRRLTL